MRFIVAALIAAFVVVECKPKPQSSEGPVVPDSASGDDQAQPTTNVKEKGDEVKETKTTQSESKHQDSQNSGQEFSHNGANGESVGQTSEKNTTHTETQKEEKTDPKTMTLGSQSGSTVDDDKSVTKEKTEGNSEDDEQSADYDKDGKNISRSESGSQSNYEKESSHSSHNSTAKQENSSDGNKESDKTDTNAGTDVGTNNGRSQETDAIVGQSDQADQNGGTSGQTNAQVGQTNQENDVGGQSQNGQTYQGNNAGNQTNAQSGQTNQNGDTKGQTNAQTGQTNQRNDAGDQSNKQTGQTNQENNTGDQTNVQTGQKNQNGDTNGQTNAQSDHTSEGGDTKDIQSDQKDDGVVGTKKEGAQANTGRKFHVDEDIYRQLEKDEIALGLVPDDGKYSSDTSNKHIDYSKLLDDFRQSVAKRIQNIEIVSDGNGNPKIVNPNHLHDHRRSAVDILNKNGPYRSLAQKYGESAVGSHYANVYIIKSRYDLPSYIDSTRKYEKMQKAGITKNYSEKVKHRNRKYHHDMRDLFGTAKSAKHGYNVTDLQLSPMEWKERERKEKELKKGQIDNIKSSKSYTKKFNKIDPLVRKAILQDLENKLKMVKAESSSAVNTATEKIEQLFTVPINKQNEMTNADNIAFTNENEILGHIGEVIVDKPNHEVSSFSYDAAKDINQIITNNVEFVSPEVTYLDEFYDIAKEREDKLVSNAYGASISNETSTNNEKYPSTSKIQSDTKRSESLNTNFESDANSSTERDSIQNFADIYDFTETNKKDFEIEDHTKYMENRTENSLDYDNLTTESSTYTMVDSNIDLNKNGINPDFTTDTNLTNYSNISLPPAKESTTRTSVNTISQILTNSVSENKIETEKVDQNISTIESKSEVNSQNSSDINLEKLKTTITTKPLSKEKNELNVTSSQEVIKEIGKNDISKYDDMNNTTVDELHTINSDVVVLKESSTKKPKEETKIDSETDSAEKFVALNKRNLEETDISSDYNSTVFDSSNTESEVKTISSEVSQDKANGTVLIDNSTADAFVELTHPVVTNPNTKPVNIDTNGLSKTLSHEVLSDGNTNSSYDSNFDTTVVNITSVSLKDVNNTTVTEENSSVESSERLFSRSTLETDKEYNTDNSESIASADNSTKSLGLNDSNKNETSSVSNDTNLPKVSVNATDIVNTDVDTYNASDFSSVHKVNMTKATVNTTVLDKTAVNLNATKIRSGEKNDSDSKVKKPDVPMIEIAKAKPNVDNRRSDVKENAGSSNYTSITAANSTSTTKVDIVNQSTENRPVGDNDKTDKPLTIVISGKSETSVKSDKTQSSPKSDKPAPSEITDKLQTIIKTDKFLESLKSDRENEESRSEIEDSTSKSDESRSVSAERLIFSDLVSTEYSASTSAE